MTSFPSNLDWMSYIGANLDGHVACGVSLGDVLSGAGFAITSIIISADSSTISSALSSDSAGNLTLIGSGGGTVNVSSTGNVSGTTINEQGDRNTYTVGSDGSVSAAFKDADGSTVSVQVDSTNGSKSQIHYADGTQVNQWVRPDGSNGATGLTPLAYNAAYLNAVAAQTSIVPSLGVG